MTVPTPDKTGQRRYGDWAGNPEGHPEDTTRCVEEVWGPGNWHPHQCQRKRGHGPDGLFCKQHAAALKARQNP